MVDTMQKVLYTVELLINYSGYSAFNAIEYNEMLFQMLKQAAEVYLYEALPVGTAKTLFAHPNIGELQVFKADLSTLGGTPVLRSSFNQTQFLLELPTDLVDVLKADSMPEASEIINLAIYVISYKNHYKASFANNGTGYIDIGLYQTTIYENGTEKGLTIVHVPVTTVSNFTMTFTFPYEITDASVGTVHYYNETVKEWESGDCTIVKTTNLAVSVTCLPSALIWGHARTYTLGGLNFKPIITLEDSYKLFDIRNVRSMTRKNATGLYVCIILWGLYAGFALYLLIVEQKYKFEMFKQALKKLFTEKRTQQKAEEVEKGLFDKLHEMKKAKIMKHYMNLAKVEQDRDTINTSILVVITQQTHKCCHRQENEVQEMEGTQMHQITQSMNYMMHLIH
eukprot:TRINITY_DN1231_c0_g1_i1.p1 TRINITY_DN1231_c0_g1~~TRINITY_DN1231_c0_g1_i1.p1  ORF type:complete len:396 (-),score=36.08 TRINITY_DN1231_c0_g1_i1:1512-2699(-)